MTRGRGMRPGRAGQRGAGLSHYVLGHTMPGHTVLGHTVPGPSPDGGRAGGSSEGRRGGRGSAMAGQPGCAQPGCAQPRLARRSRGWPCAGQAAARCSARCRRGWPHPRRAGPGQPGSPKTTTPATAPTSGSMLRNAPATSAGSRLCPKANRVNGTRVPPAISATTASRLAACAGADGRPSVSALNGGRDQGRTQELHRRYGDRVAAAQQPGLADGEHRREQDRGQHHAVAGQVRAATAARGDQSDPAERDGETGPGDRPHHAAVPHHCDDRDHHGGGADEQRRMADAGPGDARVLQQDRPAVPRRTPGQHRRAPRRAYPGPGDGQQHGGAPPRTGWRSASRAAASPGRSWTGARCCPTAARRRERHEGATAVDVHASRMRPGGPELAVAPSW